MEYCSGGGVAGTYCYKFAQVAHTSIDSRSLLKLTPSEVRTIQDALGAGLKGSFGDDRYVYYVSENGTPLDWHGFGGNANRGVSAPYIVCPEHNAATWQEFEFNQSTEEDTDNNWADPLPGGGGSYGEIMG